MRPGRITPNTALTLLLMWLLPLCSVVSSGLELLAIPGNAPKICKRLDHNGENNSVSAEKDVHHIPPAHRHSRHHQVLSVAASAPPKKLQVTRPAYTVSRLSVPPYRAVFPSDCFRDIAVPPPEKAC